VLVPAEEGIHDLCRNNFGVEGYFEQLSRFNCRTIGNSQMVNKRWRLGVGIAFCDVEQN
jgi:hypothetical protein